MASQKTIDPYDAIPVSFDGTVQSQEEELIGMMSRQELIDRVKNLEGQLEQANAQTASEMNRGKRLSDDIEGLKLVIESRDLDLTESNRVRDIYKEQWEGTKSCLGEAIGRERVLDNRNSQLTRSIDELKSMLYRRDLDISRIQGQLDLLLQQQTSATIEVPREVWNERSAQRNYNGDSPNGSSHHFSWWNIGNAD